MHRLALGDPEGAVKHARVYLREGYDLYRFASALLDVGEVEGRPRLLLSGLPELDTRNPYRDDLLELLAQAARVAARLGPLPGESDFAEYLRELRLRYNQLPALKDELGTACG